MDQIEAQNLEIADCGCFGVVFCTNRFVISALSIAAKGVTQPDLTEIWGDADASVR